MSDTGSCIWYLKHLGFFPRLDERRLQMVAAKSEMQVLKSKSRVDVKDIREDDVLLLKSGRLAASREVSDGRAVTLDVLGPGDMIGAVLIDTKGEEAESVEALEDCLVCKVRASFLKDFIEQNSDVDFNLSERVGLRRRRIESRLLDIMFCTVPVRLARTIADLADRYGEVGSKGRVIKLALAHRQFAEMIGANREATTRAMGQLIDAGAIAIQGKFVCVRDRALLDRIAER